MFFQELSHAILHLRNRWVVEGLGPIRGDVVKLRRRRWIEIREGDRVAQISASLLLAGQETQRIAGKDFCRPHTVEKTGVKGGAVHQDGLAGEFGGDPITQREQWAGQPFGPG